MLQYLDFFQTLIQATKLRRAKQPARSAPHLQRRRVAQHSASIEVAANAKQVGRHLSLIMARLDRIEAKIDLLPDRHG